MRPAQLPQAGSTLDGHVRRRTAWLPFAPVTVRDLRSPAAPGPDPAAIADIVELALHALAGSAPPARADIEVQPGEQVLELLLTITPLDGATVRARTRRRRRRRWPGWPRPWAGPRRPGSARSRGGRPRCRSGTGKAWPHASQCPTCGPGAGTGPA